MRPTKRRKPWRLFFLHPWFLQSVKAFCGHAPSSIVRLRGNATRRWQSFLCWYSLSLHPRGKISRPRRKKGNQRRLSEATVFDRVCVEPSLLFEWERLCLLSRRVERRSPPQWRNTFLSEARWTKTFNYPKFLITKKSGRYVPYSVPSLFIYSVRE